MSSDQRPTQATPQPMHTCTGAVSGMHYQPCPACQRNFAATGDRFLTPEDAAFLKEHAPEVPQRTTNPGIVPPQFDYVVEMSDDHTGDRAWLRWQLQSAWLAGRRSAEPCSDYPLRSAVRHYLHDLDSGADTTETYKALVALAWPPGSEPEPPRQRAETAAPGKQGHE